MTTQRAMLAMGISSGVELTSSDFARVSHLMRSVAGIELKPGKEGLVRSRLSRRLRALHLHSVGEYLDRVEREPANQELAQMVDALTTNKTEFFRERAHFDLLEDSVAMSAHMSLGRDVARLRVLATDISGRALEAARRGRYSAASLKNVPVPARDRFFDLDPEDAEGTVYHVSDDVRRLVRFASLNLMADWPMKGSFDVIFCRNVMIYFNRQAQQQLVDRFTERLSAGGMLLLGHSESLTGIRHALRYVQPAAYGK